MKNYQIEIKWGIIFFVVSLLWMYFEKLMGWHDVLIAKHAIYTNFFGLLAIAIYFFAIHEKGKKIYKGKMTWKEGFISGLILTIVIAVLSPLGQYITHEFITPHYFQNVISYSTETGSMERENAEAYFNLKAYIIQSTAFVLMSGVVTAAVVALLLKRNDLA